VLLAIDPSVNSPGVALFENGRLQAADRILSRNYRLLPDGQRWLEIAKSIASWLQLQGCDDLINDLVFERPQWYAAAKSKGDPNQLAGLAGVAAATCGILATLSVSGFRIKSPTPAEWIGQLPKATKGSAKESPRARRILSRLDENEIKLVPNQHDAIDAVGLGLWALGRLTPRTVLSNGRDGR
jgi:hypothetical protein